MDILSSLNTNGTGIDITQLSNDLANAEVQPRKALVSDRIDEAELSLTGFERMRGQLEILQESMDIASTMSTVTAQSSSSAINVEMTNAAQAASVATDIEVLSLAQSQVLEFTGFDTDEALVGAGSITVDFGEWAGDPAEFTVNSNRSAQTINTTDTTTLADLATSLNALEGVNARVVNVGDGTFSLGIVSETGAENAIRLAVTPPTASETTGDALDVVDGGTDPAPAPTTALQQFDISSDPSTAMIRNSGDAQMLVDGINVGRSSNEISDLVSGITLTLTAATTGPVSITSESDPEFAREIMESLLADINATTNLMKELTNRGFGGGEAGELSGDPVAQRIEREMTKMLTNGYSGFGESDLYLSDFGVRTERDGTLSLDTAKFDRMMKENPSLFESVLQDGLRSTEPGVTVDGLPAADATPGSYTFQRDAETGDATLNGDAVFGLTNEDGSKTYFALSGPLKGATFTVAQDVNDFEFTYGKSPVSLIRDKMDEYLQLGGAISDREATLNQTVSAENEELDALDERLETLIDRYLEQFTYMETIVTQLNNTGDYLTNLIDSWNADN